jgi:hypothetical protein
MQQEMLKALRQLLARLRWHGELHIKPGLFVVRK